MVNPKLTAENECLRRSWDRHSPEYLDAYLASNVEDPRVNCQSILTRALLVDALWPGTFDGLINEELRFGAVLTWLMQRLEAGLGRNEILDRLASRDPAVPQFVVETCAWLEAADCPVANYIAEALLDRDPDRPQLLLGDRALSVFSRLWSAELDCRRHERIRVLEPACGSANDYRSIAACGLSRFLDYAGFDVSAKNIANARRRFPNVPFSVASVFDSGFPDEAFDYVFVHDLFEHLSPEGLEVALREVIRMSRKEAWLHFFNVEECDRHEFNRVEDRYSNTLSIREITGTLRSYASEVEVVRIPVLLEANFGCGECHNKNAVTILVTK